MIDSFGMSSERMFVSTNIFSFILRFRYLPLLENILKNNTIYIFSKFSLVVIPEYKLPAAPCEFRVQPVCYLFQIKL